MTKVHDIMTKWGQALLTADAALERPTSLTLPLTLPEKTVLENAAAQEGLPPEAFLRAVFIAWYGKNWKRLRRAAMKVETP